MDKTSEILFIDTQRKLQYIDGFGASGAWWAQIIGRWSSEERHKIIEFLFTRKKGIGLTIFRYNIGAGSGREIDDPWRRTKGLEVAPGQYDWSQDESALLVLREACESGVQQVVAFANSPPARMTKSGYVSGHPKGVSNLRGDMYEAYGRYLVDIACNLRYNQNLPINWISPINEPRWDWNPSKGQEGCHYTHDECRRVTQTLLKVLSEQNLDFRLSVVEAAEWENAEKYMQRVLSIPEATSLLHHFCVHSYWSNREDKLTVRQFADKNYLTLKLWMSEWCEMKKGRDIGMESALVLVNVMHVDLTIANVSSWQYWIAVSKYDFRDGLIYVNEKEREIIDTKRLWAMGNYSKFIRPGFSRIHAESDGKPAKLKVSAFMCQEGRNIVLVVINDKDEDITAGIDIRGNTPLVPLERMEAHETSATNNVKQVYAGQVLQSYCFLRKSVTTVVIS